jgi:secreted Zn-dependent insulinase-like peptidase
MAVLEEVNYQDFLKFKSKFGKTLKFEGVMCGHITQENAEHYAKIIRESIDHNELAADDKFYPTNMLKLKEKTVHNH